MKNPEFMNSFTFTGTITRIKETKSCLHVTINQNVADTMSTDFRLVVPFSALPDRQFLFSEGDIVLVQDAVMYEKANEMRLRVERPGQIRVCSQQGLFNSLSFSGKIVELKKGGKNFDLMKIQQTVCGKYVTTLEVLVMDTVKAQPKQGEIICITSAMLYDKNGLYRAKIENPSEIKLLYSPDTVLFLGKTDAKERFA